MAKLLIVGGTGFAGSAVTRRALAAGHEVALLNRGSRLVAGCQQITVDRNRADDLRQSLEGRAFDAVIDTNAYTPAQADTLLRALGGRTPAIVAISSASVYGDDAIQPADESQPTGGAAVWGAYGRDKSAMEAAYLQAADLAHVALVRPPYIFGPDNSSDRETWFWSRQLNQQAVLLPGDGCTPVQFVHCDDLADALLWIVAADRRGREVFNVADPAVLTLSELASILAEVAGAEDRQQAVGPLGDAYPPRSWFPFRDYPCLAPPHRFLSVSPWRPAASLRDRFEQTLQSYSRAALGDAFKPAENETALRAALGRQAGPPGAGS